MFIFIRVLFGFRVLEVSEIYSYDGVLFFLIIKIFFVILNGFYGNFFKIYYIVYFKFFFDDLRLLL